MGIQDWRQNINDDQDLTPNGKLIGYTLANYYRQGYETFPSISSLETSSNLSKNTVMRAINELEELGHISVLKKVRKNRSAKTNHYEFIGAMVEPMNEPMNEPVNELSIKRANERSMIAPEIRGNKRNKLKENISKDIQKKNSQNIDFSILGLTDDQLKDWKVIRKSKGGSETQRALNQIAGKFREARDQGYTNEDIVNAICENKWTGFEVAWLKAKGIEPKKQPQKVCTKRQISQNKKQNPGRTMKQREKTSGQNFKKQEVQTWETSHRYRHLKKNSVLEDK